MFQNGLELTKLVNLEEWQRIQDSFSDVLELTLRTISLDGKSLLKASRPNRLCDKIPSEVSDSILNIKEITSFKCPFGLEVFLVPIKAAGNRIVAYILVGPIILKKRKDASQYAKEAKKSGIKLDELMDALIAINVFTYNKIYSITKLVEDIFSNMAQTGYHKKRLGEIAPEIIEMDPLFSLYYEEKVLNALLDACTLALDADSGSVMTVDKKTNMLHMKVSKKLNEGVKDKADTKVGEGIAGFVAATARPIILPKDEDKNGLSGKLKRKYIKSSVIIPFNKGKAPDVYGVINLNIVRKDRDFSAHDIAVVKELVNIASVCLVSLKQTNLHSKPSQ